MARCEAEPCAGRVDHRRAPKAPARQGWVPLRLDRYHRPKRHPNAGEFRLWSLLGPPEMGGRTVGRLLALSRQLSDERPHGRPPRVQSDPTPPPYKATAPQAEWCIDGRKMDFALAGGKGWSRMLVDGYTRTMLAGATAPTEARGGAVLVLSTACRRYGAPKPLLSESGGAYIAAAFRAGCRRWGLEQQPIKSTQGPSYVHWMEPHCKVQR